MNEYEELSLAMSKVKLELENLERAVLAVRGSSENNSMRAEYISPQIPRPTVYPRPIPADKIQRGFYRPDLNWKGLPDDETIEWNCKSYLGKR